MKATYIRRLFVAYCFRWLLSVTFMVGVMVADRQAAAKPESLCLEAQSPDRKRMTN